jgi:hypothetical protein
MARRDDGSVSKALRRGGATTPDVEGRRKVTKSFRLEDTRSRAPRPPP